MKAINPVDVLLWTFRRNEKDIVNLYETLSFLMQISTGGNMLNLGYWDEHTSNPHDAQISLCNIIGKMADFKSASSALDIGSGFSEPALIWRTEFPHLDIHCVNVNLHQLEFASRLIATNFTNLNLDAEANGISLTNAIATRIPFSDKSIDRVIALESAQHFRPLTEFIPECRRVLTEGGILILAIPIVSNQLKSPEILSLGILSFTWSSEHFRYEQIKMAVQDAGFRITDVNFIGKNVYVPLADYYIRNRKDLRQRILKKYPTYVEKILFKSMQKMKEVSQNGIIDYVIIRCLAN